VDEKPFLWPQKGDQLFNPGEDWWLSAYIQPWNKDFHAYATGYKQAADIVSDAAIGDAHGHKSTRDYVIYPVVFLYRHYIELRLKEIILLGTRLYDRKEGLPKHHRIDELWKHARSIIKEESNTGALDEADACITEFSKMDHDSESFRYPITKEGKRSIQSDHLVISIRNLREVMDRLGSFLDSVSDYLYILIDQKTEFEDNY